MQFSNSSVSTQTFTIRSNIQYIDLNKFYESITPATSYELPSKNIPKLHIPNVNQKGIIAQIKYQQMKKGEDKDLKIKKKNKKTKDDNSLKPKKNFLNCITIIMYTNKRINIKFFKNGVLQLTGCKHINHVIICINAIYEELIKAKECFIIENNDNNILVYIKSVMRNIDFNLGYEINRFMFLKKFIELCEKDENIIFLDAVADKTEVKIKIRISKEEIEELPITRINLFAQEITILKYESCMHIIEHDKRKLENKFKDKFVTITVFQNGKVLLSGADESLQKKYFEWFVCNVQKIEQYVIKPVPVVKKTFLVNHKSFRV